MYDFTTLRPRRGVGAEKWRGLIDAGLEDSALVPFSVADMEFIAAPGITAALTEAAAFGIYGYTMADDRYLAAVQSWMARRHRWTISPDWIVNAFGAVHAINQALHAFTREGDQVVIQTPVYNPFRTSVEGAGRRVAENPLRLTEAGYEMDFEGLAALLVQPETTMLLLCSPHNPVGRVWTRAELCRLADLCHQNHVLVFSDEVHFDMVHSPHRHTVYAALKDTAAQNCVVATSASKSFNLAGLATANVIIPNGALRERFVRAATGYTGFFNNYFGLTATRAAYETGADWLDALLPVLRRNFTLCRGFLAEKFPSVRVCPMEGTYLMWADFRSLGLTPEEQTRFMREDALLWLDEGRKFGAMGAG
ncbi:MAG: putative C-S lyase, partial [Clostridiales bacterium]|nr:putative C-S lyase [Clostridiales bacterium]